MENPTIVIVDVQVDFLDPTTPAKVGAWSKSFCLTGTRVLIDVARQRSWPVVHVGTRHADGSTLPNHLKRHNVNPYCLECTPGVAFIFAPLDGEDVIFKTGYSAFEGTSLHRRLRGASDVVFAGVATDCCILQSVFDGDRRGMNCGVFLEAASASSEECFASSLTSIAKSAGDVLSLRAFLASGDWQPLPPEGVPVAAREWFSGRAAALGPVEAMTLEVALSKLAAQPSDWPRTS